MLRNGISSSLLRLFVAALGFGPSFANACTAPTPPSVEQPEIEIEPEFEDYDRDRDRLLYKLGVEVEVGAPTQLTTCQCGIGLGTNAVPAPSSFNVLGVRVTVRPDNAPDEDLDAFAGFDIDNDVSGTLASLPGFNPGSTPFGFSASVQPFLPPVLNPNEHLVMDFLVEFAPADFEAVSGNALQFAAGSTDPGHQLSIFNNYQGAIVFPNYNIEPCDFNSDQECNVDDLNALMGLGDLATGVPVVFGQSYFDLNDDGVLNRQDVDAWLQGAASYNGLASTYLYGDANLDGFVDGQDFNQWNAHKFDEASNWDEGNFNGDLVIDGQDFNLWNANKFRASTVPEPSSMLSIAFVTALGLRPLRRFRFAQTDKGS